MPEMTDPPRRQSSNSGDKDHQSSSKQKMAAQSQGIKQLMAAEKEAAQVVANARKSKNVMECVAMKADQFRWDCAI